MCSISSGRRKFRLSIGMMTILLGKCRLWKNGPLNVPLGNTLCKHTLLFSASTRIMRRVNTLGRILLSRIGKLGSRCRYSGVNRLNARRAWLVRRTAGKLRIVILNWKIPRRVTMVSRARRTLVLFTVLALLKTSLASRLVY